MKLKLSTNPANATKFLLGLTALLVVINILIQFLIYDFGLDKEWFLLFNMDKEVNLPTLFSCILLLLCASLIYLVINNLTKTNNVIRNKWNALKLVFIFLAFDEALQIHELFIIPSLKPNLPAILTIVWVIPYGLLTFFAIIYFLPLIFSLPIRIKYLTLLSGFIYLSGALGLEIVGSYLVRTGDIRLHGISYGLISTLEETLEILGLILFAHALMILVFSYQEQKLKINLSLSKNKT